ncbi:MAG: ABC transporter ATP-binding protein [Saccharofermentans sp.]|nr:ABC transporter ATP-binding protein [Saccharofermentans sp.]
MHAPRHTHILKVHHLSLSFPTRRNPDPRPVLDDVDFSIRDGEILGLIGNSGSGKTMTAMAIAGLLPEGATITNGSIKFCGEDLVTMSARNRRKLAGRDIGVIFQEPMSALDPLMRVGKNLAEVLVAHGEKDKDQRREKICSMLRTVGFEEPEAIMERYPHQLSGGQRQRVLIAGAALMSPRLLICDEPTSSLDTVTTVQILDLLKELCRSMHMTILFISHDLSAVKNFCDRVMVMRDGRIIDKDTTEDLLTHPKNGYTAELLTNAKLDPRLLGLERATVDYTASPILVTKKLNAGYDNSRSVLKDVDLKIYPKEILGLIGSSGCGKTTLTKSILGIIPHTGEIKYKDSHIGAVFQDPVSCLNPAHTVRWHLTEPIKAAKLKLTKEETDRRVLSSLAQVGLDEKYLDRRPKQLSGGQRQRIAIAMCLILNPKLIVADEPFSSLDASSQAEILKLLTDINREQGTAFLLITHNIHVVRQIAPRVVVMDDGKIVEEGLTGDILTSPKSKAAIKLLSCEKELHGLN